MNEILNTIHQLRTTHGNFDEKEVSTEDLQIILQASVRAANASARQAYSIIVVEDSNLIKELCGYTGSKALLYCVDSNRLIAEAQHLGHSYDAESMADFVTGSTDTILAAQTAVIAARSLGIDSLLTNGVHRGDINRVYDLLDLPRKHCFPLIMLVLGYAEEEPPYLKGRLSGAGIVHYGKYQLPEGKEMDALIAEYDDPEKHLGLTDAWRDMEMDHYLDWFFTKWMRPGGPKPEKSQLLRLIEEAGFLH